MHPLELEGKWSLRAHGQHLVLPKRHGEKASHCWLKGFLWYLYVLEFPHLVVEKDIGHRYKPDLVAFPEDWHSYPQEQPVFWAECGQVHREKLERLFRQFPQTHFVVAKWGACPEWVGILQKLVRPQKRRAPVELLCFPENSLEVFLDQEGGFQVTREQVRLATF
jgi:hypothetical protein